MRNREWCNRKSTNKALIKKTQLAECFVISLHYAVAQLVQPA